MFGLDTAFALQMENQLMDRHFGETITFLEGRLAQREDPWDRYFLALARFLCSDARHALNDMTTLVVNRVNDITQRTPEEVALVGAWGMQLAQMAEIPLMIQDQEILSVVELGLSVAELAGQITHRRPDYWREAEELRQRFWMVQPPGASCKRRYLRPASPRLLQVEPTNHCNLDCVMCPRRKMTRPLGFMDLALWQRLLDTWENRGGSKILTNLALPGKSRFRIHFSGVIKLFFLGEPLLHKQLPEMVQRAHQVGCQVAIQTNGVLLDRPVIRKRLLDACPEGVGLSIDGFDAASYAAIRRNAKWDNLVEGVEALHRERRERGLEERLSLNISTILAEDDPLSREKATRFLAPLRNLVDTVAVISLDRDWAPEFTSGAEGQLATYARTAKGPPDPCANRCNEPMTKLNVLWDGAMTPCCTDYDGVINLGHVQDEGGIDGVWNGDRVLALQKAFFHHDLTGHPFCQACLS